MDTTRKNIVMSLKHEFTQDELRAVADELAQSVSSKKADEDELKSVSSQIKSKIALHDATISADAEKIRSGYEYRKTKCSEVWDYIGGIVTTTREDTGEIVTRRGITEDERQLSMKDSLM